MEILRCYLSRQHYQSSLFYLHFFSMCMVGGGMNINKNHQIDPLWASKSAQSSTSSTKFALTTPDLIPHTLLAILDHVT